MVTRSKIRVSIVHNAKRISLFTERALDTRHVSDSDMSLYIIYYVIRQFYRCHASFLPRQLVSLYVATFGTQFFCIKLCRRHLFV